MPIDGWSLKEFKEENARMTKELSVLREVFKELWDHMPGCQCMDSSAILREAQTKLKELEGNS